MNTFETFEELSIPSTMKDSLKKMNFLSPTPVQAKTIPASLEGRDIIATAQTGTGKTGAFGVPMLSALYSDQGSLGLVLAPTRELAAQIHDVLKQMAKLSSMRGALVVGGESFGKQKREIENGVDWLVATPGRLNDHLKEGTIDLSHVTVLVLDEVDRMLDMGFLPQIKKVLRHVPRDRQTLLFSATLPEDVKRFADSLVYEPLRVAIGDVNKPTAQVAEKFLRVPQEQKTSRLLEEIQELEGKVLVFARTKSRTQRLVRALDREGIPAVCLHGGRTQGQRKTALTRFRDGSHSVMVATDLAGRGLDIVDIDHVINFDMPGTREDYIHRIGRTGRAGKRGSAVSFVVPGNRDEEKIALHAVPENTGRPASGAPSRRPHSGTHGNGQRYNQPQRNESRRAGRSRRGRNRVSFR